MNCHSTSRLSATIHNKYDGSLPYISNPSLRERVTNVHDQRQILRLHLVEIQEQVFQVDETALTDDWQDGITIADKYEDDSDKILQSLSKFKDMWGGRLGRIKTARQRIKLTSSAIRPVHSIPYHANPTAR